jgi:hypothetical protein
MKNCHDCKYLVPHSIIGTNTIFGVGVCKVKLYKKIWKCEDENNCCKHKVVVKDTK